MQSYRPRDICTNIQIEQGAGLHSCGSPNADRDGGALNRSDIMADSHFRECFEHLRTLHGRRIEWPQLLRYLLEQEFIRIRRDGQPYTGPGVFLDRDEKAWQHKGKPRQSNEELLVYSLYRDVHEKREGLVDVGGEATWLVTCQVPNQANHRGRRADLLGLRANGSLVVFECKVAEGKDSPLIAVLEGFDYLAHLLLPANLEKLDRGLRNWRKKDRKGERVSVVPEAFAGVDIKANALHSVIVLAPPRYYDKHCADAKDTEQDWYMLSDRCWPKAQKPVGIDFSVSDFKSGQCSMLELPYRP
jgi:hypothetical protein